MQLTIVIAAHPDRRDVATKLADQVSADHIEFADNGRTPTANHRAAWAWHTAHTTEGWAIVLEDDAMPCTNFRAQAEKALTVCPARTASLYMGRIRPPHWQNDIEAAITRADTVGAHWITTTHMLHAVAIAAEATHIRRIHESLMIYQVFKPDSAIGAWHHEHHQTIAYSVPSLVDHNDELATIIKPEHEHLPGRVAWRTGTRRKWTDVAVPLIDTEPKRPH